MDSNCKGKFNLNHVYCHPGDGPFIHSNSGSAEVLSILKENKQLKAMLLLHLDLIQEQSDQLLAKDKLLARLREENAALKVRVERMDKRTHRNKSRAQAESSSLPANNMSQLKRESVSKARRVLNNKISALSRIPASATQTSPVPVSAVPSQPVRGAESNYKICDDNYNVENKALGENNGKYITKIVLQRIQSGTKSSRLEEKPPESAKNSSHDKPTSDSSKAPAKMDFENNETVMITDKSDIGESENISSASRRKRDRRSMGMRQKEPPIRYGSLITSKTYCSREWQSEQIDEDLNEESEALKSECPNLEIPKWTIKEVHGLYAIEGTEDLSDDVFQKRHNKQEIDEKRRKKWDVQRIREQRTLERLRRRHCKEEMMDTEPRLIHDSFYPAPNSIKYIQITDEIPVNAFGEVIPKIKEEPFTLPWSANSNSTTIASPPPSSPVTSTTTTTTASCSIRKSDQNQHFGTNTCLLVVKKRRRQPSERATNTKRTHRRNAFKN